MMEELKTKELEWIYIKNPTDEDILYLRDALHIHELVLDQLRKLSFRPTIEQYDSYIYMIMHFPIFNPQKQASQSTEVDFLIFRNKIVTVHYDHVEPIDDLFKKCSRSPELRSMYFGKNSGTLLYHLIHNLLIFSLRELDHVKNKIEAIEEAIFSGKESAMVREISVVQRDILNFHRTIKPEHGTLESLEVRGDAWFGPEMKPFFTDLMGDYMKVWNLLESYKETIESLRDTNQSLLSTRTNSIIQTLTLISVILLPTNLVVLIFSSSLHFNASLAGIPLEWWVILVLVPLSALVPLLYFKVKRWL